MKLVAFPEVNANFTAPDGFTESQIGTAPAFYGVVQGGSMDGVKMVVVAWRPEPHDLEILKRDGLIYLTVIGGLPPHLLSTTFQEAISPA